MFLKPFEINNKLSISEIVRMDYRTAEVFRRYGIGYCCGGKWPMDITCEMQGINIERLQGELETAIRTVPVSSQLDFFNWDIDFLIRYIINIHHQYLKQSLPLTEEMLKEFVNEHIRKFPWLAGLEEKFLFLKEQLLLSVNREEEVLFPYIRQIAHAHKDKEPYAVLLVKMLRKPVEDTMFRGHEILSGIILSIRELTQDYDTPSNVCTSHKVVMAKLKELDNDIMHHFYLEQSVLFPRAIAIEKEVLAM